MDMILLALQALISARAHNQREPLTSIDTIVCTTHILANIDLCVCIPAFPDSFLFVWPLSIMAR